MNPLTGIIKDTNPAREDFFKLVFGSVEGYMCFTYIDVNKQGALTRFFKYPQELDIALSDIMKNQQRMTHAYYCPQLFKTPTTRTKENVSVCTNIWADLDSCDPTLLAVEPTILVQTSPNRWQALWLLERPMDKYEAESISRKIAYSHAAHGADKSGWDLSQLLRIPYTSNYKYGGVDEAPIVSILVANRRLYRKQEFDLYPEIAATQFVREDAPPILPDDPLDILQKYRTTLNPQAFELYNTTPPIESSWSEVQWKLIQICVEAGLDRQETFTVINGAACNKFRFKTRRPITDLWAEIQRGYVKHLEINNQIVSPTSTIPELLTKEEQAIVHGRETYIERYIDWAKSVTDAAPQYHQAGAFTSLCAMVAGTVRLETSFGPIRPNLWFSCLGDTTITRKSTAINLANKLIKELDEDIVFATDGSSEGILTGLADRENKSSLFYRDEITGLFQAILTKDYMSDMLQHLTSLYDGDTVKRLLRKEEIIVRSPVFLMLTAGIKHKVQLMLTEEHIASGFIPRFIFITAEPDISRMRPMGPPIRGGDDVREVVKNELIDIRNHYNPVVNITRGKANIGQTAFTFDARLTPEAWKRYNDHEYQMVKTALDTGVGYLTPVYDRLSKSTLKAAILIAASRQRDSQVLVEVEDLLHAIYYCRKWREYSQDVVSSVGKSAEERLMDIIYHEIKNTTGGKTRHELMRDHHLTKKIAAELFDTLEQRQLICAVRYGNDIKYHTI